MKNFTFLFLLFSALYFSQEKKSFHDLSSILKEMIPNNSTNNWVLHLVENGKDYTLKKGAKNVSNQTPNSGFFLSENTQKSYYYIAVFSSTDEVNFITTNEALKDFVGKQDNAAEAIVLAVINGYIYDIEYKDVAGNYYEDSNFYYLDLGKIVSESCPFAKDFFTLTIDKKSGATTNIKDNGNFFKVYDKKCTNDPKNIPLDIKKQDKTPPKKVLF